MSMDSTQLFLSIEEEKKLLRLNRVYRTIAICNQYMIHAANVKILVQGVCNTLVNEGGYHVAWVGFADNSEKKRVIPQASAGIELSYLEDLDLTWADNERGQGPDSRCIREGKPVVVGDYSKDTGMLFWKAVYRKLGFASSVTIPLKRKEVIFGAISIYSDQQNDFEHDEIVLLVDMASDIAYGINSIWVQQEREALLMESIKHEQSLVMLLESTIQAIATIVEKRDPYTAGHQRRVAKLAVAIAQKMGINPDRVEGLRLASIVHDIGKVSVPTEILTNPNQLDPNDFEVVKTHPVIGFEILRELKFSTPVAQIVSQHHERLNGTGYPNHLKGEHILVESRILAVADVVEAIISHRPYRPARSVSEALEEIEKASGEYYDSDVVNACCKLFREDRFQLEDEDEKEVGE